MKLEIYNGKRVLVTGHTGFKGSWLSIWLQQLGAEVCGLSADIPTKPSLFEICRLSKQIDHRTCSLENYDQLLTEVTDFKPDFIFHLAAQTIVKTSYEQPLQTISSNVMGSAHIMEVLRRLNHDCTLVMVTSDKCYQNNEWKHGYRECDPLGGKDIYSASKGACEILIQAYYQSYFSKTSAAKRIVSARAGNVIGGGDFAEARLIPDCIRAWSQSEPVSLRNPDYTRPWQHVLEPLYGYLLLAAKTAENEHLSGEAFNFAPPIEQSLKVGNLVDILFSLWKATQPVCAFSVESELQFAEARALSLSADKAFIDLGWLPRLDTMRTAEWTIDWYQKQLTGSNNLYDLCRDQIKDYSEL